MLFDHLHRVIHNEFLLLHSLHYGDDSSEYELEAYIQQDIVGEMLKILTPRQKNDIQKAIGTHFKKIQRVKEIDVSDVSKATLRKYFSALKDLREDKISKSFSDEDTMDLARKLETNLKSIPKDEKKKALKGGVINGLIQLVAKAFKGISAVGIIQLAALVCIISCVATLVITPPQQAFQQRMSSMVTTGDFISNLNEVSDSNILPRFARAAMFQGNELLLTSGPSRTRPLIEASKGIKGFEKISGVDLEKLNLINKNQADLLTSFPLNSLGVLEWVNEVTNIKLNYDAEIQKAAERAKLMNTVTEVGFEAVIDAGFWAVDLPKEAAKFTIKKFGSEFFKKLWKKKTDIAIRATKILIADMSKESLYQKRMNEGFALLIDSIIASLLVSATLKAASYFSSGKLKTAFDIAKNANDYYRVVNIFCYSAALTLTDLAVDNGVKMLGQMTGIQYLNSAALGTSVILALLNVVNATLSGQRVISDGKKLLMSIGETAREMVKQEKIYKFEGNKQQLINYLKSELEISSSSIQSSLKDSRVALMKF